MSPDEIEAEQLKSLLDSDERPRILDIRGPNAFTKGHIPGSENVPFGRLPAEIERFEHDDHIVTVCPRGQASLQAVRLIRSYEGTSDTRVESLAGGLEAWDGNLETNE